MVATLLDMAVSRWWRAIPPNAVSTRFVKQAFDLVLTDYALPRKSGLWLLEEAESEGLIQGTPVLIVTAHPNVERKRTTRSFTSRSISTSSWIACGAGWRARAEPGAGVRRLQPYRFGTNGDHRTVRSRWS
jgi:CheY-like chemotaxis protein